MNDSRLVSVAGQGVGRRGELSKRSTTSAYFVFIPRINSMEKARSVAQQIAEAASAFEQERTGHAPTSVTVVVTAETVVITLHGALSPAEMARHDFGRSGQSPGVSPAFVRQFIRTSAAGNQKDYRSGRPPLPNEE
jgi:Na+-translocating membrane potential-generating system (MpsC)